ncbi:MAG: hypothetical protein A4S09_14635 [Proteobacteria bacterium SG_bin7]|nr:MAG: hypothetical protein A4S09_14635 [Proteobacteria bacterium SG_bin7]
MIRLIVCGSEGRMGKEITRLVEQDRKIKVVAKIDKNQLMKKISADVVVDFTLASEFTKILSWCVENKIAFVSGTTGITAADKSKMKRAAKKIPVFWAPNMSLGVNFVINLLKSFGKISDFDFEISETHHINKKDKPSGTALWIKETLEKSVRKRIYNVASVREGEVFGDHKITATSSSEKIILEHRALNREVFAKGAIAAVRWIANKKKGLYSMSDLLKDR